MKTGHIVLDMRKIEDRCEWHGDCLVWLQSVNGSGQPYASHDRKLVNVRRLVFQLTKGICLPKDLVVFMRCGNSRCLNSDHMLAMTRPTMNKRNAKAGLTRAVSACDGRIIAAKTRASNKINAEIADQIRCADGTVEQRAEAFGVSGSLVSKIDRYLAWAPIAGASVFSMAAAK